MNAQLRAGSANSNSSTERPLPFGLCALTLLPVKDAVCNREGIVFENSAILPFLLKHQKDPVSGDPMTSKDLLTLHLHRTEDGRLMCPVLEKPLNSKVVAVANRKKKEANVYSYEAYSQLNLKPKSFVDLLTGEPFSKEKDVIILHDDKRPALNITEFYHIRHERELKPSSASVQHSRTAARIMDQLPKKAPVVEADKKKPPAADRILVQDVTGVNLTTLRGAASFTSTGLDIEQAESREATEEEIRHAQFRVLRKLGKKGYVRLETNLGALTLEIHADMVPQTAANFLGLCAINAYAGQKFHRLIPSFMIQGGGDGESLWGGTLKDEFDSRLKHNERGVVSMANAGSHTGRRQFFITFKTCSHLDNKHTVFGKVIDGANVLDDMERVERSGETPKMDITILNCVVLENPMNEAKRREEKRLEKILKTRKGDGERKRMLPSRSKQEDKTVGRYLKLPKASSSSAQNANFGQRATKKTKFGDFSGW